QVVLGGGIAPRLRPGASAAVMVPQIMRVIETQFNGTARATALSAYGWCWRAGAVVSLSLETCFHASPGAGRTIASGYSNARSNALIRECWPPLPQPSF